MFYIKGKRANRKLSPLVGESVSGADERGKGEQKRKNKNKREQNQQKTILICVRKHAPIVSQARYFPPYSGEANAKEESNQVL